jgi:hypothetical protein
MGRGWAERSSDGAIDQQLFAAPERERAASDETALVLQGLTSLVVVARTATVAALTVATAIAATTVTAAITAAVVAIAATATTTAVTTTIAATFRAGAGLVHHEVAAVEILAIGAFNGLPASIVIGHLHEAEAAAPVGGSIHDDFGRSHFSEWFEEFTEILVPHSVRHVGDVNVHEFY